jgi:hypothetical protein
MHSKPVGPYSSPTRTDRLQADLHMAAAVSLLTTMWPTAHSIEMALHHWRVGTGPAALDKILDSWNLGTALDWAARHASAAGFVGVTVACEPTGHRWRSSGNSPPIARPTVLPRCQLRPQGELRR